jgi:ferrous iron transport protein B
VAADLTEPLANNGRARESDRVPRIAIAGNPNAGKTSIFNALTGAVGSVANYPGVTVETKSGFVEHAGQRYQVIDLPGTYSLTAYSGEELVARNYVVDQRPDVVLNVVDASNLERNLYLSVQLMEMHVPMVIALNMVDVARGRGYQYDVDRLEKLLGVPVVSTVGNRGTGCPDLLAACQRAMENSVRPARVTYGHMVESTVAEIAQVCQGDSAISDIYWPRWVAVKLLEGDGDVTRRIRETAGDYQTLSAKVLHAAEAIEKHFDEDPATIIAERRYGFAAGAIKDCLRLTGQARQHATDRIDAVVCNRYAGPLILLGVVYVIFLAIFKLASDWQWVFGYSPQGAVEAIFEFLARLCAPLAGGWPLLHSLLVDGVIGGVGGVVVFVPLIFIMFLLVAFLEDSGYIARVAFILDRLLKAFGLQGKSILALIVSGGLGGGGCAVPGVMAARTLREDRDRLITILTVPLMNCGAKMPVYLLLVAAFFAQQRAQMLFVLWLLSWFFTLTAAWVLRKFVIKGPQTPFVMELPPYHLPTVRGVLLHTWERTWMYIRKAGTVILAVNIVLWALLYFPRTEIKTDVQLSAQQQKQLQLRGSFAGRLGTALEPVSKLAGFSWRENTALFGGFAAKEVVVGTLGTAYSMGDVEAESSEDLSTRLASSSEWNPLRAFALMLFVMLYSPCLVTLATMRRETNSWKWPLFSMVYSTVLAFVVAVFVYQVGMLAGWGVSA